MQSNLVVILNSLGTVRTFRTFKVKKNLKEKAVETSK